MQEWLLIDQKVASHMIVKSSLIKINSDQNSWKNSIPSVFPTFFLKNSDYKKIDSYSNFSVAVSPF